MPFLHAAILGVVQGLTEFLPISSSGHLILVPTVLGWPEQGLAFDTVLHLGTLCAVLWLFSKDLREIVQPATRGILPKWIVSALPALVVGFFFHTWIEQFIRGPMVVAIDLAVWSLVLWWADRYASSHVSRQTIDWKQISWRQALWMGIAQPIALLPGSSRSGMTMMAGLFSGLSREAAVKFSFFMSIPLTAAAGAYGLLQLVRQGLPSHDILALVIGFFASFLSGVFAIKLLLSYVSKHGLSVFIYYRLALALLVLLLVR